MLDEIKGRAPAAANDLLRFTRRIFAFGVRRRFLLSNPAADFSPRLGTYDRHDYFKDRRAALERWSVLIVQAERGQAKIVPILKKGTRAGV